MATPSLFAPPQIGIDWVSPSNTRNYIKGDPILDWLDYYGLKPNESTGGWDQKRPFFHGYLPDSYDPNYIPEADFMRFIVRQGNRFEAGVVKLISQILADVGEAEIIRVAHSRDDIQDYNSVTHTENLMKEGQPVIYQPVLWDETLRIFGSPDLLVRSDFLNKIIPGSISADQERNGASALGGDWHYVVVEVKYTNIDINAAGELGNSKMHYKVQIALYNEALSRLQGYSSPHGYLIGRTFKDSKKNRGESCFDRIGKFSIDQPQHRRPNIHWVEAAKPACDWVRRLRAEGHNWSPKDGMEIPEIRPDMGNTQDAPYHRAKRQIADEIGEITKLWSVGRTKRDAFILDHKCSDWRELACSPEAFGLTESTAERLAKSLKVNREPKATVSPSRIEWSREEWAAAERAEFFVDFETVNDLNDDFSSLPKKGGQPLIFMIGCAHIENNEWCFKCFTADDCAPESELNIIREWAEHMEEVRRRLAPNIAEPKVFHWSPAEESTLVKAYDSAAARHGNAINRPNFYDFLNNVVKPTGSADCLVVKGAFNFGLKSMGKALHALGLIKEEWADGPTDGLGAMTGAWYCYEQAEKQNIPVLEVETTSGRRLFQEIVRYNEVDCKVMYEAINFLRGC